MGRTNHRKMYLLLLFLLLPLVINVAFADHGPKPSITVNVRNGPEGYYIGLLQQDDAGDYRRESLLESDVVQSDEELKKLVSYQSDGWMLYVNPVSDPYYRSNSDTHTFDYMVPSYFRVILVGFDGTVYLSDPIERKAFNAVFDYDVATGKITEDHSESIRHYALNSLLCYIITLLIEGLILWWNDLGQKKNWLHFLIINTLTQILLNGCLVYYDWLGNSGYGMIVLFFILELAIFLIEAAYYAFFLRTEDGTKRPSVGVKYAIAANLASMIGGFIIMLFL
ncbi:MAG: hypothetical protein J5649_06305 [Lachnospiraceae bacterium]|nr:hypothetical protein [Lachnospiraceae bacterium]